MKLIDLATGIEISPELSNPSDLNYDSENNRLYVADSKNNRIIRIDLNSCY